MMLLPLIAPVETCISPSCCLLCQVHESLEPQERESDAYRLHQQAVSGSACFWPSQQCSNAVAAARCVSVPEHVHWPASPTAQPSLLLLQPGVVTGPLRWGVGPCCCCFVGLVARVSMLSCFQAAVDAAVVDSVPAAVVEALVSSAVCQLWGYLLLRHEPVPLLVLMPQLRRDLTFAASFQLLVCLAE